jgi:peptidyl-tRNA hydrolase
MKRMYIVVRSDIAPGLQIAQACHAAREFTLRCTEDVVENLVVLQASKEQLEQLVALADGRCAVVPFHEPDLDGEITAAAFGLGAKKLLSTYPLALRAA